MTKLTFPALALLAGGALGFVVGFWTGRGMPKAAAPPATSGPADAAASFAEHVRKNRGPFRDPIEKMRSDEALAKAREAVVSRGPGEFDRVVALLGKPSDPPEVRATKERDAEVRQALIELLPALDARRAAPDLASRVLDTNEQLRVRSPSAGLLARLDRAVALPALIQALEGADSNGLGRERAIVEALAHVGGPEAAEAIHKALLRTASDLGMRIALAESLGNLRHAPAWPALESLVRHEESDHYVRREAVRALLKIEPGKATEVVREQIPVEKDPGFKAWLEAVLQQIAR